MLLIFHRIEIIWTNSNHDYCVVLKIFTTHPLKFSWFTSPPHPLPRNPPPPETFFISPKIAETLWPSLHYTIETGAASYLQHMHCHLTTAGHFSLKYQELLMLFSNIEKKKCFKKCQSLPFWKAVFKILKGEVT